MLRRATLLRRAVFIVFGIVVLGVVVLFFILVVIVVRNRRRFEGDCRDAVAEQFALVAEPYALDLIVGCRDDGHQQAARFQDDDTACSKGHGFLLARWGSRAQD